MGILIALSFASALTAIFAFRFDVRRGGTLALYFLGFGTLEFVVQTRFMPEGAIPVETAYVLFGITALFVLAIVASRHVVDDAPADPTVPQTHP